ncbi:MAG: carboxypeptidase regulatory-like domain-containing protein [Armatimonadetes bacterium]|nr:carboxypeptidase regulatory-like domain-containing protein [Armatimonadota bacterium]
MGRRKVCSYVYPAWLLMAVTLALLAVAPPAQADISPGWGGTGCWPYIASANSQRWFRFYIEWAQDENWYFDFYPPGVFVYDVNGDGARDDHIQVWLGGQVLVGNGGSLVNVFNPESIGVALSYPGANSGRSIVITIGPFAGPVAAAGADCFRPNTIGTVAITGWSEAAVTAYWTHWTTGEATTDSATAVYVTMPDDDDALQWYAGPAAGIDPLSVNPASDTNPTGPDYGSGSDRYVFRVRYQTAVLLTNPAYARQMRCRWMGVDSLGSMPGEYSWAPVVDLDVARFNQATQRFTGARVGHLHDERWLYHEKSDPWIDLHGYSGNQGSYDPRVLLIVDEDYDHPHFMYPENPNDDDPTDGQIFRYELLPTDYENWLDNVFLFPMDPTFQDPWDGYASWVLGRPASNNYAVLFRGGHKYEFWATDDICPVSWRGRGNTAWVQIGRPGNEGRRALVESAEGQWSTDGLNRKITPLYKDPSLTSLTLHRVSWAANQTVTVSSRLQAPITSQRFADLGSGGYGYPYDSQSREYPKVNPVLTAHPYFPYQDTTPTGVTAADSSMSDNWLGWMAQGAAEAGLGPHAPRSLPLPFNPLADKGEPWPAELAANIVNNVASGWASTNGTNLLLFPGYVDVTVTGPAPRRFTNDGTIVPNFVSITPETDPNPFVGGKWTAATEYVFRIVYWQSDNVAPTSIRLYVAKAAGAGGAPGTWASYTMQKAYPTDNDFTDGCVYYYRLSAAQLPGGGPGDYYYYFRASDGKGTAIFPNRPDRITAPGQQGPDDPGDIGVVPDAAGKAPDYYWFRVNNPPTVDNEKVTPTVGREGENFVYSVRYRDADQQVPSDYRIAGVPFPAAGRGDRVYRALIYIDLSGRCKVTRILSVSGQQFQFEYEPEARDENGNPDYYDNGTLIGKDIELVTGQKFTVAANSGNTITLTALHQTVGTRIAVGTFFRVPDWFTGVMNQADTSDDYTTGATFEFNTATRVTLRPGLHRYYFEFTDDWGSWLFRDDPNVKVEGETVRVPNSGYFEGPEVLSNTRPRLTNYRFIPKAGPGETYDGTTATPFVFQVTYVDPDNDPPSLVRVGLDGTAGAPARVLDLTPLDPSDTVYADGVIYQSPAITLDEGQHLMRAQCSDGSWTYPPLDMEGKLNFAGPPDSTGAPTDFAPGPNVARNTRPTLSYPDDDNGNSGPPGLEPNKGTPADDFTWTVVYTDTDRFAGVAGNPPIYVQVYIDNVPHDMTPADPNDKDYTDGAVYTYKQKLSVGNHTYFFVASDGRDRARLPETPQVNNGPLVDAKPGAPQQLVAFDTPNDNGRSITLRWNASPDDGGGANDVVKYRVYRATASGGYGAAPLAEVIAAGNAVYTYEDNKDNSGAGNEPVNNRDYFYVVTAVDRNGLESDRSNEAGPIKALDNVKPQPPAGPLRVQDLQQGGMLKLTWGYSPDDPNSGANGAKDVVSYRIWRSTTPGTWPSSPTATVEAGVLEYTDTGLTDGTTYYYSVTAFDGTWDSDRLLGDAAGYTSSDRVPPAIINRNPAPNATGVPTNTNITFTVEDTGAGVDDTTLTVTLERKPRGGTTWSAVTFTQTLDRAQLPRRLGVTVNPFGTTAQNFDYLDTVRIRVQVKDKGGRQADVTWQFTIEAPPTNKIAGTIKLKANGQPLAGVQVKVGDVTVVTNASGYYEAPGLAAGVYEVRPQLSGWAFEPESKLVTVPPDQTTVNFNAVPGYNITGRITMEGTGTGLANVEVTAGTRKTKTAADGSYTLADLPAGSYTVVPSLLGYLFTPASRDVTLTNASVSGQNFTARVAKYSIGGRVSNVLGDPIAGVTVRAYNESGAAVKTASTNAAGDYVLADLGIGRYTVRCTKSGFAFNPAEATVDLSGNVTGLNFEALTVVQLTLGPRPRPNFVGIPVVPLDDSPTVVFPAAQGVSKVARWDADKVNAATGARGDYWIGPPWPDPLPDIVRVKPGRGFWVALAQNVTTPVTLNIAGRPLNPASTLNVPVLRGWNMLANPWGQPMKWSSLGIVEGMPLRNMGFIYDRNTGSYVMVSTVQGVGIVDTVPANAAFWIYALDYTMVTFRPVGTQEVDEAPPVVLGAGDFLLQVEAATPDSRDAATLLGVMAGRELKVENPPLVDGGVDVYIENGGAYAADVRASAAQTMTWDLAVVVPAGADQVAISLPDLSRVPADKAVLLTDLETGKTVYMRTQPRYVFAAQGPAVRHLRLTIQDRGASSLVVTAARAQQQGAAAVVTFALSKAARVSAEVLNIAGRPVAVLAADQVAAAGVNTLAWNLRNAAGSPVPAGRYIVRIVATGDDGQQVTAVAPLTVKR